MAMLKRILLLTLISQYALAQTFAGFVNNTQNAAPPLRQAMVDSFMLANPQLPLLENDTLAHFIITGNFNSVEVAGDMNGWSAGQIVLQNISSTNFWFASEVYEANARLDYKFITNGSNWILDPNNPAQVSGGFGPNSELAMPQYVQPWEIEDYPGVPKGSLSAYSVASSHLNASHQVWVYLPPNYDSTQSYPSAYFHDGSEYLNLADGFNILNNLIDSNLIEPLIAVFVKPNNRNEEYAQGKRWLYRDFFVYELVPWVDARFSTIDDSSQRASIGASFGGNISALIAYSRPDVFFKAGLHSGAFWPNNYEALWMLDTAQHSDLAFASVWGTYEGSLPIVWNRIRDTLQSRQIPYKYFNEYSEGHSWGLWRATLDELLIQLFPATGAIGIADIESPIRHWQIYPNPSKSYLKISGLEGEGGQYSIRSLDGRMLSQGTLKSQTEIDVQFLPSGLYLLELEGMKVKGSRLFKKL